MQEIDRVNMLIWVHGEIKNSLLRVWAGVMLEHHMAGLLQTMNNLALQTRLPAPTPPPAAEAAASDASSAPRESYLCNPEPFDGDLDKC